MFFFNFKYLKKGNKQILEQSMISDLRVEDNLENFYDIFK
jgi:hypothetical protein